MSVVCSLDLSISIYSFCYIYKYILINKVLNCKKSEIVPDMSLKCPERVLLGWAGLWDNYHMEQLLTTLTEIGIPADEVQRVRRHYRGNVPGLRQYVLYMKAMLDDRHEYLD